MLKLDMSNIFTSSVGAGNGLDEAEFEEALSRYSDIAETVERERKEGDLHQYLYLPYDTDLAAEVKKCATSHPCKHFVVLGIGGSALGPSMLQQALQSPKDPQTAIHIADNIDPDGIYRLLDELPLKDTVFNIITKSGGTAETIATAMIFLSALKQQAGSDWPKQVIVTTGQNKLRTWAEAQGLALLPVPDKIGGRFSVLTSVGLLAAVYMGIDVAKLLTGAQKLDNYARTRPADENAVFLYALAMFLLNTQKGKHQLVMMPYANRLYSFADWFRQLWAESLGKIRKSSGEKCFIGQTPIKALGATDQHSQIQLYVEGPADKVLTFLRVENFQQDCPIPVDVMEDIAEFDYLRSKNLAALLHAEQLGTQIALQKAGRPNCTLHLERIDEEIMGMMIIFFELATTYSGMMYGINTYDQPGVEAGKIAAYALLDRQGYEDSKTGLLKSFTDRSIKSYSLP
ncbi:glucose-6-phosphate isomerase [Planctomycetota bacterium]